MFVPLTQYLLSAYQVPGTAPRTEQRAELEWISASSHAPYIPARKASPHRTVLRSSV